MNDDLPACAGAGAPGPVRRTTHTTRSIVLALGLVLGLAVGAGSAQAATWANEIALRDETSTGVRNTFVVDPGAGNWVTRAHLLDRASFYAGRGFDRNFLTWAPETHVSPDAGTEWARCGMATISSVLCPDGSLHDFNRVRASVVNGDLTVLGYGGAFISLVCGNHSRNGAAVRPPTISGVKYEDVDGDGARDSGEPGIANWTIRLYREDVHVRSTTTAADGSYAFALDATAGLEPGRYTVVEDSRPGWEQSSANPAAIHVPYGAGDTVYSGNDFGNYRPATIEGVKYEDMEADGDRDGDDPLLAGWTIDLGAGRTAAPPQVTGSAGAYGFAGLRPGTYTVTERLQDGWRYSTPSDGVRTVTVRSGESRTAEFGNYRPATIDGVKYEDMEADGDRDADDPLLAGWTIDLGAGPTVVAPQVTDSAGAYAFAGLRPGTYSVAERLQDGWRYSTPSDGARTVTVRSGESRTAEFGNYRPPTIEGVKFDDHNVNRLRDAADGGLPDWTISLSGGRSPDAQDVTDSDGRYAFTGLIPGTYDIDETLKPHWRQSAPESVTHTVKVRSGETGTADFGNICLGTTRVLITEETTGAPLTGVEVRIEEIAVPGVLKNDPKLPLTTTGTPTFADLLPGTYRVIAFLPTGVYTTDPALTLVDGRLAVVKDITVRECATTDVPIKMFETSTGKVTGGMKMRVPGGFATAGYVFMTRGGVPQGSLEYIDHVTGMNLHSEQIQEIHVRGNEAWIGGLVVYQGALQRFQLHLVDNGEPGSEDRFELLVEPDYRAGYDQTIEGGNDQVHKPERT